MPEADSSTVLLVEDNPTNLKVLFGFLKDSGFRVLVARNGEDALQKLAEITPDLILLDVMMPEMDGFETCRHLKSNRQTQDIPVIFMTALADTENKMKAFSLGAVDYITKPFQQAEVLARVNLHLKLRRLTQELAAKSKTLSQVNLDLEAKVTEKTQQLQSIQAQLILQEKMSSLGGLVAGIAHEINNPVGFIAGNLSPAYNYAIDLIDLVELYQQYYPDPVAAIREKTEEIDLEYLVEDFPQLIQSLKTGTDRIAEISRSMRTFSRTDRLQREEFDIHEGLESTLLILKHRLKANSDRPEIQVIRNYGSIPLFSCFPGQLNQVFMNLLANSIDALEESNENKSYGEIEADPNHIAITTYFDGTTEQIVIEISDNGRGMSPETQQKVFEHLFTTKPIGKGTGLGLTIARQAIVESHGGDLAVTSTLGQGTTFYLKLPLI
ncbi:MAG: response regulator [Jaaginema sp. PMC 1079.18]|nr:response regulator [Jaaginema sp. PMC 1080.18]MEC4851038.1 response regulator [Jaaginema sp. PMC 1079.18]MEC4866447.1 response regulator [Jaaginema sp. PMC 1078.18]